MVDPVLEDTRTIEEVKLGTLLAIHKCAMGRPISSLSEYTLHDKDKYSVSTQRQGIVYPNLIKNPPPLVKRMIINLPTDRLEKFKEF